MTWLAFQTTLEVMTAIVEAIMALGLIGLLVAYFQMTGESR